MRLQRTGRFDREYRSLEEQVKADVDVAIDDLMRQDPAALRARRNHQLRGYTKPRICKIDVRSDKSYQISYEKDGDIIVLRRIAKHKELDRRP